MAKPSGAKKRNSKPLARRILGALGPGVITGAADDDPSGITTYSIAGAQHGTSLLWTAWLTWPLMACVQMVCARIGMVTGRGLTSALKEKFPRGLILMVAVALLAANTINIAADLAGMADAAEMLTGVPSPAFIILFGLGIGWATLALSYPQLARILKWLALALFAYVIEGIRLRPDWGTILRSAILPAIPRSPEGWATLVAILGTTISPYLFFWQTSQEVEEEKAHGLATVISRIGANKREITDRRIDIGVGTFFSNLVMFFVILTTGLTLHEHGVTRVETTRQIASALRPLAGRFAETLYTAGLVGVGLLAIPTLSGSAAYALAECFGWKEGLGRRPRSARYFYGVIGLSTAAGIALDFLGWSPVRALFVSALINGVLAPILLVGILVVARDSAVMKGQPVPWLSWTVAAAATLLMLGAAVGMFVF